MMTAVTAHTTTAKDSFLRFAIRLDAVLSGLMGVVGIPFAPRMAELSGTTTAFEYSIGAFFIAYGVAVYGLSRKQRVRRLGLILVIGNLVYTALAVAFVLADVMPLTTTGVVLTLGSGAFTLVMAELQYQGLRRARG
jgi:peptidoglycan/LPS O-acetylase OafA/YrhL